MLIRQENPRKREGHMITRDTFSWTFRISRKNTFFSRITGGLLPPLVAFHSKVPWQDHVLTNIHVKVTGYTKDEKTTLVENRPLVQSPWEL
jgi:hypothetical protein